MGVFCSTEQANAPVPRQRAQPLGSGSTCDRKKLELAYILTNIHLEREGIIKIYT